MNNDLLCYDLVFLILRILNEIKDNIYCIIIDILLIYICIVLFFFKLYVLILVMLVKLNFFFKYICGNGKIFKI